MDELIKRIVEARKSKGLTQSDISHKIGISRNSYTKIETKVTELSVDHLIKIAGALGVSVVSLIDPDAQSKDYFQELNAKIEALEKTVQEKDEFIQLQKQNISNIKTSIVMVLRMAEDKALNSLADNADKLTALEAIVQGIVWTSRGYLELLEAIEVIGGKEIDLYFKAQKEQFQPIEDKFSNFLEPKAHRNPK